jgi:hypothetical protein
MNIHSCKARFKVIFYRLDGIFNRGDYIYRLIQCLVRDFFLCFSLELSRVAYISTECVLEHGRTVKVITCHCAVETTFFRFHYQFKKMMHRVLLMGQHVYRISPLQSDLAFILQYGECAVCVAYLAGQQLLTECH